MKNKKCERFGHKYEFVSATKENGFLMHHEVCTVCRDMRGRMIVEVDERGSMQEKIDMQVVDK